MQNDFDKLRDERLLASQSGTIRSDNVMRLPFFTLRATLRAAVRGHEAVLDHLAFALSAEGAVRVPIRTLLLGTQNCGVEHLTDVLTRHSGLPAVVCNLDTPDSDHNSDDSRLRNAILGLGLSGASDTFASATGGLLVLRGFVAAACADRVDFRGGVTGGPRISAALRALRGDASWTASYDQRVLWPSQLAVVALDEVESIPLSAVGRSRSAHDKNALHVESLFSLGVPHQFIAEFPRRYRLLPRNTDELEAAILESDELCGTLEAAWSLQANVTVSPQVVRYLAYACSRGELSLRRAIDLLCENVERVAMRDAREDPFATPAPAIVVTPDDLVARVRAGV